MKRALSLVFFTLVFKMGSAQQKDLAYYLAEFKYPVKDGEAFFEVIDSSFQGKSQSQIYKAFQATIADLFKNSKNVVKLDDDQDGHMIGKGTTKVNYKYMGVGQQALMSFTFDFKAKDGKYRLQMNDFSFVEEYRKYTMAEAPERKGIGHRVLEQAKTECDRIIALFQAGMRKSLAASNDF